MKFARSICLATLLIFPNCTNSYALDFGIEFGLDRGTRDLFDRLPDEAAEAALKVLKEGLPLIDASIDGHIDHVDAVLKDVVETGVTAVQCGTLGTVRIIGKEAKMGIGNLLYTGGRSDLGVVSIGNYTEGLTKAITAKRDTFNDKTTAVEIAYIYSDLLIEASIIKCAGKPASGLVDLEVEANIQRIEKPGIEWLTLIGDIDHPGCTTPGDCVAKRRIYMADYLKAADPRDLEASHAVDLVIGVRPDPVIEKAWFGASSIQILDYEQILVAFRKIERAVETAKATRMERAKSMLADARRVQGLARTNITNNRNNLTPGNGVDNKNMLERAPGIRDQCNDAVNKAKQAKDTDNGVAGDADQVINDMTAGLGEVDQLVEKAKAWLADAATRRTIDEIDERLRRRFPGAY